MEIDNIEFSIITECINEEHDSVIDFLYHLKKIGANGNAKILKLSDIKKLKTKCQYEILVPYTIAFCTIKVR